ncbi:MAG: SIS domain-containing protein [Bacteroidales bacterium]
MKQDIQKLLDAEAEAIQNIPLDDSFEKALTLIHRSVHLNGGKVIISGMGKAGQIATNISTTLSSTGTPAVFIHPSDAQHGDLGVIQNNDILLVVSNSGKTREIIELVGLARNLVPAIPVILITGNPENELSNLADVTIYTGNPPEVCPLGLTPTTSTTVMTVIGDILVVMMMKKIDFKAEDYAKRHHGGYLGYRSRIGATNNRNI